MSTRHSSRRAFLRHAGVLTGGAVFLRALPGRVFDGFTPAARAEMLQAGTVEAVAARRAQMGAVPIQTSTLGDRVVMLSGPGGNVVVLHGPDGKIVVDSFVQPAWPALKTTLDGLGKTPIKMLIDTHWHFDHTDNNANIHETGAAVLAHTNTKKRLSETHDLLGMHFDPSPAAALPTETFSDQRTIHANGEDITLVHIAPAHTDSDICAHYTKSNVLHMGDVFFNGMYPFIDASTGGNINGMIGGAEQGLKMSDGATKIVPGHGPLGNGAALENYRVMLTTVRDRVAQQKKAGRTLPEVQTAKPTADFDAAWGKGMMGPDDFVALVYSTL